MNPSKKEIGVHFTPDHPVERLGSEGPLDQILGIHVDDNMDAPLLLADLSSVADLLKKCPGLGEIDLEADVDGESIREILAGEGYITADLAVNPDGASLSSFGDTNRDRFGVDDVGWLQDPKELIWKSALLAQLQAKYNALSHFLNGASAVDFGESLTPEERQAVAQRARQLAAELKDDALGEIGTRLQDADQAMRESRARTYNELKKWTVTNAKAIAAGGLSQDELDRLFPGGKLK